MTGVPPRAPPAGLTVRPALPNDLPAVTSIERASFSDPWSAASFRDLIARDGILFHVVETDDAPTGEHGEERGERGGIIAFVVVYVMAGEAEVANLAVSTLARRRGVGKLLMRHVLESLAKRGVHSLFLEVRESNVAARALYDAFAFETVGRRSRYYVKPVEDALLLRRALP
jgi:ribosomal-protein-alanine N-acetyltransferase